MISSNSKKVVVIKNIQSNLIEEAIFILKSKKEPTKISAKLNECLLKEAEFIINNYIQKNWVFNNKCIEKPNLIKSGNFFINIIINTVLIGSIALLLILILKIT